MSISRTSVGVLLFSSLIFEVNMSDEMSDEKGWIFMIFAPVCPQNFLDEKRYSMPYFLRLQGKETLFLHSKCYTQMGGDPRN